MIQIQGRNLCVWTWTTTTWGQQKYKINYVPIKFVLPPFLVVIIKPHVHVSMPRLFVFVGFVSFFIFLKTQTDIVSMLLWTHYVFERKCESSLKPYSGIMCFWGITCEVYFFADNYVYIFFKHHINILIWSYFS